jgi:hypothetical protein
LIPALLAPLAGCFSDPADEIQSDQASGPPPPPLCAQFRKGLETLSTKGALDYQDDGSATVEERVWMAMGPEGRDKIAQMLAFHASCVAKEGSASQRISIRNQFGNVLTQRSMDTRMNTGSMFGD